MWGVVRRCATEISVIGLYDLTSLLPSMPEELWNALMSAHLLPEAKGPWSPFRAALPPSHDKLQSLWVVDVDMQVADFSDKGTYILLDVYKAKAGHSLAAILDISLATMS